MSDVFPKTSTPTLPTNNDQPNKPGLRASLKAWAVNHPATSTVALSAATTGAIAGVKYGVTKAKDHFAAKATAPAKEQAANLVSGVARSFAGRFGK